MSKIDTESFATAPDLAELTDEEINRVGGGVVPVIVASVAAGAAVSGYGAYHSGANAGAIASAAILGGVSGFYGSLGLWTGAVVVGAMASFAGGRPAYMVPKASK